MDTFEKIKTCIKTPFMTNICSTMTQEEHIHSMANIILEINKETDAKFLAEIINDLQRKLFECENMRWKQ